MPARDTSRRTLLAGMAGLVGTAALSGPAAAAAAPTPRAAEGPFYPEPAMRAPDIDNDLVRIAGRVEDAGGEVFTLRGTLRDRAGRPLPGRRVEIWQCDVNGRYLHPRDRGSVPFDAAFQGFGHDIADAAGAYVFRTIKPAIYPGRAPHIHVKILDGDREVLVTQFYIKDHPLNPRDVLFRRMSPDEAEAVSMTFTNGPRGPEAVVNVIL
jgi:protocatechuate 3,4-dioxygenase beta subunit